MCPRVRISIIKTEMKLIISGLFFKCNSCPPVNTHISVSVIKTMMISKSILHIDSFASDSENVSEKISRFSKYKTSVFLRKLRIFPFIKLWLPCGNWNFTRISQSNEAFFKFLQPTIQTCPVSSS
ncbi:hypothetical protein Hanom_Chr03g00236291 [Helianthus anomalus]